MARAGEKENRGSPRFSKSTSRNPHVGIDRRIFWRREAFQRIGP